MSSFFFFFFFFSLLSSVSLCLCLSFVFISLCLSVSLSLSFVVFVTTSEREREKKENPHHHTKKTLDKRGTKKKGPPSSSSSSSSSVRATFWEHRSFRARVILESPRRVSFRFVAFRLVFLPRARFCANDVFLRVFFEKGEYILGLRKRCLLFWGEMVQTRTWEERFERLHGLVECIDARGKSRFAGRGRLVVVRVADAFAHFSFSSRTKLTQALVSSSLL